MSDLFRSVFHQAFDRGVFFGLKQEAYKLIKEGINALTGGLFGGGGAGLGRDAYRGQSPFPDVGGSRPFGRMMQGGAPTESGGGLFDRIGSSLKNAAASLLGVFLPGPQTTARLGPALDSMGRNIKSMIGGTDRGGSGYNRSGYNEEMTRDDIARIIQPETDHGKRIPSRDTDFRREPVPRYSPDMPQREASPFDGVIPLSSSFGPAASGEVRGQALPAPEREKGAPVFQNHYQSGLG